MKNSVVNIVQYPVHNLRAHPYNKEIYAPRTDAENGELEESIRAHGIRTPLVVTGVLCASPIGTVLAGHGRLEAARRLGLTHVPVVVKTALAEDEEKSTILVENRAANTGRRLTHRQKYEHDELLRMLEGRTRGARNDLDPTKVCGNTDTIIAAKVGDRPNELRFRRKFFESPFRSDPLEAALEAGKVPPTRAVEILRQAENVARVEGESSGHEFVAESLAAELEKISANGGTRPRGRPRKTDALETAPRPPTRDRPRARSASTTTRATATKSSRVESPTEESQKPASLRDLIRSAHTALGAVVASCGPLVVPPSRPPGRMMTPAELAAWNGEFDEYHAPILTAVDALGAYADVLTRLEAAVASLET